MSQEERVLLYQQAIDTWGQELQLVMAIEETSELQKEVCKILRGDWSSSRMDSLAEEVADTRLMLEQIEYMCGIASKVELVRNIKLARLKRLVE